MDRYYLITGAVVIVVILFSAYALLTKQYEEAKYSGVSISASPAGTERFPRHNCYMDVEPLVGVTGARVAFASSFTITNLGEDLPAGSEFHLIFNSILFESAVLESRCETGAVAFSGKKDFLAVKEFRGADYSAQYLYSSTGDFPYKLVYCINCNDPLTEGVVIYQNSTRHCCKPSTSSIGSTNTCD